MNSSMIQLFKLMGKSTNELKEVAENDNFTILSLLKSGVISILISSILNIILAAIFKSKTQEQF